MGDKKAKIVNAGKFYTIDDGGHFRHAPASRPDVWICRRLVDYPAGQPDGSAIDTCRVCSAAIIYNPARVDTVPADTPKVCMQCADLQPLPMS